MPDGNTAISRGVMANTQPGSASFRIDFRLMAFALFTLTSIYVAYRIYQQVMGWSAGLDATAPEFDTYWLTLFKVQTPILYGAIAINATKPP